ncbi:MAG: hybrid sensor histidine kinase/response regulator [Sulfurovum sp.]|nr:MAG: hybrid sensor histidine kinase/response regulator [Sulfurovum sp.]
MINKKLQTLIESNKNLTVLYVEDSDVVRDSTLDMMKEFFSNIDSAKDGEEGLQKYEKYYNDNNQYYDIVITDINMPKMNGIEMSKSILSLNEEQIILIISAHNESDYLLKLINMGISNFILKPIDITQFQKIIFRIITSIQNKKVVKEQYEEIQAINLILASAKKEAEQASHQKSQFLANMSHEIRTPLNAITGFISLLHEKETDAEKIKYLQVIKSSSDSLLQIISDILDISKIESGKIEIDNINFNPYEELITVAELFQEKAAQNGVELKIHYSHKMPEILFSDAHRIKQILSNLLSNAVKFTPKGSVVKCIVCYAAGRLHIRVKDFGIGIPEDKQKVIFEPFSQAENSTSREYGGTGLGLAISAKLAKQLGGKLTLKSQEGRGSTFTLIVKMPIGKDIQENMNKVESEGPLTGHILIVEDMEANRMFLGIILDNAGLTYDTAINGIEAIEKFKTKKYDLILMDENMPKMSGITATKVILTMEKEGSLKHTPIISLTANALKGDKERFLKSGMDDYLSKPVDPNSLTSTLRKYLINT